MMGPNATSETHESLTRTTRNGTPANALCQESWTLATEYAAARKVSTS